jgi:hypothetical protein
MKLTETQLNKLLRAEKLLIEVYNSTRNDEVMALLGNAHIDIESAMELGYYHTMKEEA